MSEDIAVSILYEHRLAWIVVTGVGREFSKHRLGISIDEGTRDLKVPSADITFDNLSCAGHGWARIFVRGV